MSSINPSFNVHNNHQLQQRQQNYVLDRKLLTVHSDDRDICKWPRSNHFEIRIPEQYLNIQSMRLVEVVMPANYYTFSNQYQNTKLSFRLIPKDSASPFYVALASTQLFTIEIQDGFYCPEELVHELENRMNDAVTQHLADSGVLPANLPYNKMKVYYDNVGQKLWFGNTEDEFILEFDTRQPYDLSNCEQPVVWDQYTKWGLPSYLGFERKRYPAQSSDYPIQFQYVSGGTTWISPAAPVPPAPLLPVWFVQAPLTIKILGEKCIYMEVDKYNSYDELEPYSQHTSNMYNNDYNGKVDSAFAKIPITTAPHGEVFDSRNGFLQNVTHFEPPLERLQKLKFKFRYHDGRLVDFQDFPFNFTLEFNMLKNEIGKCYSVRVPHLYNL